MTEPMATARRLVLEYGWNATAYQILNPGIELWFARAGDAVIGFVRHRRMRVVAGAPVCAPERLADVAAEYEADAAARRERVCYFAAESRFESLPRADGPYARVLLGAQPVWRPQQLLATIAGRASLRAQLARARNHGVQVTEWERTTAEQHPGLQRCLAEWLATRGLPPLHFLVEPDTLEQVMDRRVFVAERGGAPVAYLVASPIPRRRGWLVEQIVRGHNACNGTSELLLFAAATALARAGAEHLTLGLAPLTQQCSAGEPPPRWLRWTLGWLRAHGRRFYNFAGLEAFKAKFRPEHWEPVFALAPCRQITPAVLYAIAGAFARTSPLLLCARGLLRAIAAEHRRLWRWLRRRRRR
ncbi:MAG TPA: phosphatidylglycerol lysyltransferase domain-containing protein [Planctomycetota bacterium]